MTDQLITQGWKPAVRQFLQSHHGIIAIDDIIAFGASRRAAYRLADSSDFELVLPGILRSVHWPLGREQMQQAVCRRFPYAAIAFVSAALEWKMRGVGPCDDVHVLVPHHNDPDIAGVFVHRCRELAPFDVVERHDGTRVTTPTRTLFDCADWLGVSKTASILEQLIDEGRGTYRTHAATAARLARSNRPGAATMARVISLRPAMRAAMQSELELLVARELDALGVPQFHTQYWTTLSDGSRIRFDFAWPELRVALEVDHRFWHAGAEYVTSDKQRDVAAATDGWLTLRITDFDVATRLRQALTQVARVVAHRAQT